MISSSDESTDESYLDGLNGRTRSIDEYESVHARTPGVPLDDLIIALGGAAAVAEMTGRRRAHLASGSTIITQMHYHH